ncbi:hypothetical protein KC336_g22539, partial [Hortaea werneckii]
MPAQTPPTLAQILTLKPSAIRLTDLAKTYNQAMSRRAFSASDEANDLFVGSHEGSENEGDAPVSNAPGNAAANEEDHEDPNEGDRGKESSLSSGSPTDDYVSAPTGPQFTDTEREAILY